MTNYPFNIFDQFGGVSNNLSEAEIAKCSPDQQAVLFPLLEAWADTQAEDQRCNEVEANRRKAQTTLDRAEKVLQFVTPVWTAHMEWERTIKKMPTPEPDPAVVKKVKAAQKARDGAEEYLAACIAEIRPAQALRDQKRKAFTERLREWTAIDGRAKDVGDLVRERVKTETKQKLANIANGLPPDYAMEAQSSVGPSHLDRVKASGGAGHRGNINVGHNRNAMRGAQLPSER